MSKSCSQLEAYLAHTLPAAEVAAFEAHADACAACSKEIASWRSFGAVLKAQLAPIRRTPTQGEVALLLEAAAETPAMSLRSWLVPTLAVAAAALVAVVGFSLSRPKANDPVVPPTAEYPWAIAVLTSTELANERGAFVTQAGGRAVLSVGEDQLGLGPATELSVSHANAKSTLLRLEHGVVAAHVNPARGKRNFDIETPLGRVHVVGTVFRVKSNDDVLQVDVVKGVVEVEAKSGVKTRVPAGHGVQIKRGEVGEVGTFDEPEFSELSLEPAKAAAEPVDAGAPEPVVVAPKKTTAVAPSPALEWRRQAARGDCKTVIQTAEQYVQKETNDSDAWLVLGDCRRRERAFAQAVDAYVAASKTRDTRGKNGLLQAAELLQQELNQPQKAVTLIDTYLRTKPEKRLEAAALVRKARALEALGQIPAAKATLNDVVKRMPETPSATEAVRLLERL